MIVSVCFAIFCSVKALIDACNRLSEAVGASEKSGREKTKPVLARMASLDVFEKAPQCHARRSGTPREATAFLNAAMACAQLMMQSVGGIIIAIVHPTEAIRAPAVDGGAIL